MDEHGHDDRVGLSWAVRDSFLLAFVVVCAAALATATAYFLQ